MPQHTSRGARFRRKDLRQPDEFESLIGQGTVWVQDHLRLVLGAAAAVLGVALVVLLLARAQASRNETAAAAFRAAQQSFEAGRLDEAAEAFAAVARDYGRMPSGRLAALYRAHALARKPDPTAAATAYGEYLTGASAEPSYLRQEALAGVARAREASGDASGALEAYEQAGALDGPYRVDALLGAARLSEAAGHGDRAREIYTQLLKDAADPELRALLVAKLPPGTAADGTATAGATP